jgi:hypothetical protein
MTTEALHRLNDKVDVFHEETTRDFRHSRQGVRRRPQRDGRWFDGSSHRDN